MKRVLTAFVVVVLSLSGGRLAAQASKTALLERIIVRVNGEILTQSELTQRQIDVLQEQLQDKTKPSTDAALQAEIDKVTPDVLVESVDELLLVQRGREMGAKYTDEQFKQSLEKIKKDNKLDDAAFKTALAQQGLTVDELRQQLERSYLKLEVQRREIGPSMTITQEEQRQYYDRHKDRFMTPVTITLREIFIPITSTAINGKDVVNPADEAAARQKIDDLRARAVKGDDFAALVSEASESSTKAKGGLVGPLNLDDLNPALQEAIAGLQPGGVSAPLKGAKGYQLFELEARSVPELKPFEGVRAQIQQALQDERLEPETQKLLARLRTQAVIEWKDDNYRQLYQKRIADK
ncbi:MAG: peptidyl-prolyl cis-trans isomerase [Vicinamibacterales bacterium]